MREYVHLHRKALASWVFEDPRRWHLFSFLLMKADERGRVEMSVREYAEHYGIDRNWVNRCLHEMAVRAIVEPKVSQKRTILIICKYEDYNTFTIEECAKSEPKVSQSAPSQEEKEEERERKFPPHPLIKKEKSEKREELSATSLRRKGENDGQGFLFQELKEENDCAAVNTEDSTPKAPSTQGPKSSPSGEPEGGPVPTFEQFWDAYAYKRDRRAAERAWKRLSTADRRAAYEGIEAYRADCAACQRQMMYAQGYLNRRRWEDDFTTSPRPTFQNNSTQNPNNPYGSTQQYTDKERIQQINAQRRFAGYAAVAAHYRAKGNQE